MNKLPLIFFAIFAFQAHIQTMEDTRKSNPMYTQKGDVDTQSNSIPYFQDFSDNSTNTQTDFYTQDQATQKKQIEANLEFIHQYELLFQQQVDKLANHDAYMEQISRLYHIADQQTIGIRNYDPLINDQALFEAGGINPQTPSIQFLLLAQEYLCSSNTMSNRHKQAILTQISNLLPYQVILRADLMAFQPQNVSHIVQLLPGLYNKALNMHKHLITSSFITLINQGHFQRTIIIEQLNELETQINRLISQKNEYADAFALIHQDNQATTQSTQTIQETTIPVQSVQQNKERLICAVENAPQPTSKKKSQKKSAPQIPVLSAKQQAALVIAEKKAEQSKRDKERRNMEQEDKLSAAAKIMTASTVKKSKNSTQKKQNTKHNFKPIAFDEDDAILQAAIEENKKIEDAQALEQAIKLHELLAAQGDAIEKSVKNNYVMTKQNQEFINYLEFIEACNQKHFQLQAAKEIETNHEYEKLKKISYKNRSAAQAKIDKDLSIKYSMFATEEQDILNLLNTYADIALDKKTIDKNSLEDFEKMVEKIVKADCHLIKKEQRLKWYLASSPNLYKKIKEQYIKFQTIVHQSSRIQQGIMKLTPGDISMIDPLEKQKKVAEVLQRIHTNNGVLDITKLLHPIITHEELDALGSLQPAALHEAQEDITSLFHDKKDEHDYTKIEPILKKLLHQAGIKSCPIGMIPQIINNTAAVACIESENEKKEILEDMDLRIFNELQVSNELNIIPLTDNQMADIAKAQATALRILINYIQV